MPKHKTGIMVSLSNHGGQAFCISFFRVQMLIGEAPALMVRQAHHDRPFAMTQFNPHFRTFTPMIIYNETYVMDDAIEHQWLNFMRTVQIPAIMKTGWFSTYKMLKILESPNEGVTYCLQLFTDKRSNYDYFLNQHLHQFHVSHNQLFENRFVLFNTLMEEVV